MTRAVPAVSRALDILELFLDSPTLSAPEIVRRLGLPRTTVHQLVCTLLDRGYLTQEIGQPAHYRLGAVVFQLGGVFAENLDLAREAQTVAVDVAAACAETVHVAVLDGTDIVYIARVDSTHPVRMVSAVGKRIPAHCTGVGKMLLSGLPPELFNALYPSAGRPLAMLTPNSITSRAKLRRVVAKIRSEGLAYDECESSPEVHCVAAGVYDHTDRMVAAMSIAVPTSRWNDETRSAWGHVVRCGAAVLSANLGSRRTGERAAR